MAKTGVTGLQRIINAFGYTWKGLRAAYRHEAAFRQELALAVVLLPLSFWVGQNHVEWILLLSTLILVLVVEILNSAIEAVVDRTGDEPHKLSGRAKDMGSAAVFLAFMILLLTWGLIAWENFS
ncbi:MAG: diacylglycerol kinase [Gammaproteobacteria bacterium]